MFIFTSALGGSVPGKRMNNNIDCKRIFHKNVYFSQVEEDEQKDHPANQCQFKCKHLDVLDSK